MLPVVTFLDRLVQPFPLFLALEAASCTALLRVMPSPANQVAGLSMSTLQSPCVCLGVSPRANGSSVAHEHSGKEQHPCKVEDWLAPLLTAWPWP